MTVVATPIASGPRPSSLADVLDLILDKGLVIDAYVRVSLAGIELLTIDARVVVASVDTYLRFAEAVNRLDLTKTETPGLKGLTKRGDGDGEDEDQDEDEDQSHGDGHRGNDGARRAQRSEPRGSRELGPGDNCRDEHEGLLHRLGERARFEAHDKERDRGGAGR